VQRKRDNLEAFVDRGGVVKVAFLADWIRSAGLKTLGAHKVRECRWPRWWTWPV
jgi:hypothetical protein